MTSTIDRSRPEVVAFDVNETLLDLAPVGAALVELGQPEHLLPTVFARTLLTGFAATVAGDWCRFRDAFDAALAQVSELSPAERSQVADTFGELVPHPDVEPALRLLAEAGVRAVTVSHGSPGVAEAGLARGGLTALVERSMTSESIRAWKPAREVYLWAAGSCRVAPERLALVAAHDWDCHGARRAGLVTGFVARRPGYHPAMEPPDVRGDTLAHVVDGLLALARP